MNIALFCPNWVGDLVMATPAMRALRTYYSSANLVGVLRPQLAEVLAGLDLVNDWIFHQPRRGPQGDHGWKFAQKLRQQKFDLAVVFPNSFRSAWWSWVSGAKRRIGLARQGRSLLLTDPVPGSPRSTPHPVLDEYLRVTEALGVPSCGRQMELATTLADMQRFEQFCDRHPAWLASGRSLICLNPGGAFGSAKHWPVTSFASLAQKLASDLGKRVLVLCGPAEREQSSEIARLANHPGVASLADTASSLGLTKAAVRNSDLLITTDSGPRHFAAPFGIPVVTLFGPTHVAWSETHYERSLHLQREMECGPCQQRVCPQGHHRCMRDLSVAWVLRAAMTMMERYPAERHAA